MHGACVGMPLFGAVVSVCGFLFGRISLSALRTHTMLAHYTSERLRAATLIATEATYRQLTCRERERERRETEM